MSRIVLVCLVMLMSSGYGKGQTLPYQIFDAAGKVVAIDSLLSRSTQYQLILFGELHNNSIVHWIQLQMLKSLQSTQQNVVLGGEFFEKDDQLSIDEWFDDKLTDKNFEAEAKLWKNYLTDYKPLLLYAKENNFPFVATNIPRKYAALVSRNGIASLDSLSEEAKSFIAPLPIKIDKTLPGYVAMQEMMHGSNMNVDFMVEAQAIKDATMAHSMVDYFGKGNTVLHINGAYHSNNYEGIVWYIKQQNPSLKLLTINAVEQENLHALEEEHKNTADFILVLPIDSPKSY